MASMNKVFLVGNLGADPIVNQTPNGGSVAHFNVATTDKWTDKDGEKKERVEWHRVVVWGKQADQCGQYLVKGSAVLVEGSIRSREFEDKTGQNRAITEIVANRVQFMGGKGTPAADAPAVSQPEPEGVPF